MVLEWNLPKKLITKCNEMVKLPAVVGWKKYWWACSHFLESGFFLCGKKYEFYLGLNIIIMPPAQHTEQKSYTFSEAAKASLRTKKKKSEEQKPSLFLQILTIYFIYLPGKPTAAEALPWKRQKNT